MADTTPDVPTRDGALVPEPGRRRQARAWTSSRSWGLWTLLAAALALCWSPRVGQARLHAYYVLQSSNTGSSSPRIVFVLDTSGSMAVRADDTYTRCNWSECEDASDYRQSRISAARKAINAVVTQYNGQARFSLMTFGRMSAPNKNNVPDTCTGDKRFSWTPRALAVEDYNAMVYEADYLWIDYLLPYFTNISLLYTYPAVYIWDQLADNGGSNGVWTMCGDNRPYPYLRWDDLGTGASVSSNNETGALPASPIVPASQLANSANADRKVQGSHGSSASGSSLTTPRTPPRTSSATPTGITPSARRAQQVQVPVSQQGARPQDEVWERTSTTGPTWTARRPQHRIRASLPGPP